MLDFFEVGTLPVIISKYVASDQRNLNVFWCSTYISICASK